MARSVKHITLNVFAIKQDKRKINKLTFQLKRVQSKKPRVKGEETKLVVELIYKEKEAVITQKLILGKGQLKLNLILKEGKKKTCKCY